MSADAATSESETLPSPQTNPITLDDVITTVYASYPSLDAASRERQIAAAKQLAAMGEFDVDLVGESMNEAMGYYKNYRNGLGLKQYNWSGGQTFAGYRIGRGFFEPWYKERQTNDGGEFKAGFALPFLRDRDIDKRRAAVFQARIDRAAAEPAFQAEVVDTVFAASVTYWNWVAAGQRVQIAQQALQLASDRQAAMVTRADKGEIARIELVDNERLIVSREAKLVEAQLKLQQAAIKLSLFLRDPAGTPLIANAAQAPKDFPQVGRPQLETAAGLTSLALAQRPELRMLQLEQQTQELKMQQASNQALPGLDGLLTASQDVGGPADPKRDKSQFELEAGLALDVPLQRREATGNLQAARAKLAQLAAKKTYLEQSIAAEVQSARAAIEANATTLETARRTAALTRELADAERTKLERGDSNILTVNLREVATIEAELLVIDAEANYYVAEAQLHAATAAELNYSPALALDAPGARLDSPPADVSVPQP
ncbi:MAG: TolC family protein [Pirellulales bacterium]